MAELKYSPEQYRKRFDPKTYLDMYYETHEGNEDEEGFQEFYMEALHDFWSNYKRIKSTSDEVRCLEFGGGPNLSSLVSAAAKVDRIVFAEFTEANRQAVLSWIAGKPEAHDWKPIIMYVVNDLEAEGDDKTKSINTEAVLKREGKLKTTLKSFVSCDVFKTPIVDLEDVDKGKPFDVVTTSLCLEACVASEEHYKSTVAKLSELVKRGGGYLRMDGVLEQTFYTVGDEKYYTFPLTKAMVECAMKEARIEDITIVVKEVDETGVMSDCKFLFTAFGRKHDK